MAARSNGKSGNADETGGLRAMILAAGRGERLRPLTDTTPKPLVVVGGKPLIEYALDSVQRAGIDEVVINLHHLGEQIRAHVGDGSRFGVRVHYSQEDILQDTGGGIRDARRYLDGSTFVTMNSDTIVDVDLTEIVRVHRASGAIATMLLRKDPRMESFGIIETESDGRVGRFLGRARQGMQAPLEPWMYTGVQVLEPAVFRYLDYEGPFSITKLSYPAMLDAGEKITGLPFDGAWITVGTPAELEQAAKRIGAMQKRSLDNA
ncbi:MAG TPA: nucleotidyltransferase family protein [Candidatus Limnocylindrales bacterium]|nr:nucleotidyltransferase family protein [Candidatus Limnocylindrales bacterium]